MGIASEWGQLGEHPLQTNMAIGIVFPLKLNAT